MIMDETTTSSSPSKHWYLVQCRPQQGFRAAEHLVNQDFSVFHPETLVHRKFGAERRWVSTSLFPFYLFVQLPETVNWRAVQSTRGVKRIVGFNGSPVRVDNHFIQCLRTRVAMLNSSPEEPEFKKGSVVTITDGCFKDLRAVVSATNENERVVLLLNLLNRPQYVEMSTSMIAAAY